MSIYDDVAELIWENGQLSKHGLQQEKPTLNKARDTLESVVQQGTLQKNQGTLQKNQKSKHVMMKDHHVPTSVGSIAAPAASSGEFHAVPTWSRKRAWSNFSNDTNMEDNDTTMMTWNSLDSGRSFKDKKTHDEDSACLYGSDIPDTQDDKDNKAEIGQTNSKRRSRTAAIHNQSERKRRDRINEKMKELQRLVPNANKTDKASMLDEVINHLKQLQAHIQMMNMTSMPQMMFPLAMQQQQLQMSMLARMGMVNINNMVAQTAGSSTQPFPQLIGGSVTAPMFVPPSYMMPSLIHAPQKTDPAAASSATNASIPQSANMDMLKMAALYMQQMSQNDHVLGSNLSQQHHGQGN